MELSVCMIVKNEAKNIERAVLCARKVADEIIIVDTGSTDKTRSILDSMNQPFRTYEWRDSFAEARNESLKYATKDWVFWMDADDNITDDCAKRINILKQRAADSVYMVNVVNVNTELNGTVGSNSFMHIRLFPNNQGLHFVGRVHEQLTGEALLKLKRFYSEDIVVEHLGYASKEHQQESLRRNIRLQMIALGFPENRDFFSFDMGPEIYCIYHAHSLVVWYRHIFITSLNPFINDVPGTNEARLQQMKNTVTDYLAVYVDGLKVVNDKNNEKMISDIESALNTGVVNVCAGY